MSTGSDCSVERQYILEHAVHVFDARDHPFALGLVLDAFDAHPQRRQRCPQIMTDGAQHDVFLFDHPCDATAHVIERPDQFPCVGRPLLFQRFGRAGLERLGSGGERF